MSIWKGGLWGSQRFPNGNGIWKGGLWASQRQLSIPELRALLADLFGDGTNGLAFFPQPLLEGKDTLYQLDDGTTLADAGGDPVGLGLEWSKGLERGPELVTNGAFDTDADWDLGTGWTISGGVATSSGTNLSVISQPAEILAGSTYEITYTVTNYESGSVRAEFQGGGVDEGVTRSANGTYTELLTAGIGRDNFRVISFGGGFVGSVDNISVRELPGNHLTQPTSADRPLYQTDGSLHWLAFDGAGDYMVGSLPAIELSTTPAVIAFAASSADKDIGDYIASVALGAVDTEDWAGFRIDGDGVWSSRIVRSTGSITDHFSGVLSDTMPHIFSMVFDGAGGVLLRLDGSQFGSASVSAGLNISQVALGALVRTSAAVHSNSRGYGSILATDTSEPDVSSIENYLASRAGTTL